MPIYFKMKGWITAENGKIGIPFTIPFILLTLSLVNFGSCVEPTIPALGRPAALGEFYDARNQTFLGITILRDDISYRTESVQNFSRLIETTDTSHTDIRYGIVTGDRSKLNSLDVSAELSLDIMSGMITVKGSAAYFNEPKKSNFDVEGFLHYKTRTKRQVLNLLYDDMEQHLNMDILQKVGATHIVIAIEYGCDLVVKFVERSSNAADKTNIQGSLEFAFKNPKLSISGKAQATVKEETTDVLNNFTMSIYGDINVGTNSLQNSSDVHDLIADIPKRIQKVNNGFGVPMQYTLFPIDVLADLRKNLALRQKIVHELDEAILNDFVKMFERIEQVQRDLDDLQWTLNYYSNCTKAEEMARIEMLNKNFSDAALQFKINVKNAINVVRVLPAPPPKPKPDESGGENPDESAGEKPDESGGESPDNPEEEKPDESGGENPDNPEEEKPDISDGENPDESEVEKLDESEGEKPDESESEKPDESEGENPDNSDAPKPDDSDTKNPDDSGSKNPDESEGENPENANAKSPASSAAKTSAARRARQLSKSEADKQRDEILKKVIDDYNNNPYSVSKVAATIETGFRPALNKIELYKVFQSAGVEYFGRFGSFNNLRLKENHKIVYAIIMHESDGVNWNNNWEMFLNQLNRPFSTLAIVDCDFKDSICETTEHTVTRQYFRSKTISEDVFARISKLKDQPPIVLSALGVTQEIGDLFNAQTMQFTGKTLVNPGTNLNVTTTLYGNETIDYVNGWLEEKMTSLNVQPPALIYNVLLDPKSLQRSGRIFQEMEFFDPRLVSRTFIHTFNTLEDSILDADEDSYDFIQISRLLRGGATHFVHKILYGGQTSISLVAKIPPEMPANEVDESILVPLNQDLSSVADVLSEKSRYAPDPAIVTAQNEVKCKGVVQNQFSGPENPPNYGPENRPNYGPENRPNYGPENRPNYGPETGLTQYSPSFSSSFEYSAQNSQKSLENRLKSRNYTIRFSSDIFENSRGEFRTPKDLLTFLDDFQRLKNQGCQGRGKPVLYVLYPLANLQRYFGVIPSVETSNETRDLKNSTLAMEFTRVFDAFRKADGELSSLRQQLKDNMNFVTDEAWDEFRTVERNYQRLTRKFSDNLRHVTNKVEMPETPEKSSRDDLLGNLLTQFENSPETRKFFDVTRPRFKFTALDPFTSVRKKIQLFRRIQRNYSEIQFFGRSDTSLSDILTSFSPSDFVSVLYYRSHFGVHTDQNSSHSLAWIENFNLFHGFLYGKPYNKLIILDCDFKDVACTNVTEPVIHLYANFAWRSRNVLAQWDAATRKFQEKQTITLTRQSIGQRIYLGQLYNARKEKFVQVPGIPNPRLPKSSYPSLFIQSNRNSPGEIPGSHVVNVRSKVISSSDLDQRYTAFDLQPELQLALLFEDLQNPGGIFEFFEKDLEFSKAVMLTAQGPSVALNLTPTFLPEFFRPGVAAIYRDALPHPDENQEGPTHFVKEIRHGVNSIVTLGQSVSDQDVDLLLRIFEGQSTMVSFSGKLERSEDEPENSGEITRSQRASTLLQFREDFSVYSDLPIPGHKVQVVHGGNLTSSVKTLYEFSIDLFDRPQFEEVVRSPSITFVLEPLEVLQAPLGILAPFSSYKYHGLSSMFQNHVQLIIRFFQNLSRAIVLVQELNLKISKKYNFAMTDSALENVQDLVKNLRDSFLNFKIDGRDILDRVKNGSAKESELADLLEKYQPILGVDYRPAVFQEKTGDWRDLMTKLKFLDNIQEHLETSKGLQYLGRLENFEDVILKSDRVADKFLLYIPPFKNVEKTLDNFNLDNSSSSSNSAQVWINTLQSFFQFLVIPENDCFIVDCDFPEFPHCSEVEVTGHPVIHRYVRGQLESSDFIVTQKNETDEEKTLLSSLKDQVVALNKSHSEDHAVIGEIREKIAQNTDQIRTVVQQNVTRVELDLIHRRTLDLDKKQREDYNRLNDLIKSQQTIQKSLLSLTNSSNADRNLITTLQGQVTRLDGQVKDTTLNLNDITVNQLVPVGFIYVQYHKDKPPMEVWGKVGRAWSWADVSSEYAGLFFRVTGRDARDFGYIQDDNTRQVVEVKHESTWDDPDCRKGKSVSTGLSGTYSGWRPKMLTGLHVHWSQTLNVQNSDYDCELLQFRTSGGEVRPRNAAIRIWRRIR